MPASGAFPIPFRSIAIPHHEACEIRQLQSRGKAINFSPMNLARLPQPPAPEPDFPE